MPETLRDFMPLVLVIMALAIALWWGRRRVRGRASGGEKMRESTGGERERLQKSVEKLQINLMEFSRDVEGRLGTRIHTLGRLIRDADERIKVLEELAGKTSQRGEQALPALHREVYRLADDGLDKVEIARRTDTTPGEVELILGLRRTRGE